LNESRSAGYQSVGTESRENHPTGAGTVFSSKSFSAPGRHHCNLIPSGFARLPSCHRRRAVTFNVSFFLLNSNVAIVTVAINVSFFCSQQRCRHRHPHVGVIPGSRTTRSRPTILGYWLLGGCVHETTTRMTKRLLFVHTHVADGAIGVRSGSQRPFPTLVAVIINGLPT
jgi:hypothetical protein